MLGSYLCIYAFLYQYCSKILFQDRGVGDWGLGIRGNGDWEEIKKQTSRDQGKY